MAEFERWYAGGTGGEVGAGRGAEEEGVAGQKVFGGRVVH